MSKEQKNVHFCCSALELTRLKYAAKEATAKCHIIWSNQLRTYSMQKHPQKDQNLSSQDNRI